MTPRSQSTALVGRITPLFFALAILCTACSKARAGNPARVGMDLDLRVTDSPSLLVPIPVGGMGIDLWSDPDAGSLVYPGDRANVYFRSERDAFVTLISVDTEGRVRLLFPRHDESGWVRGGCTVRVPERGAGYDLRFAGPSGIEYVYAVASQDRCDDRYPDWLVDGRIWDYDPTCERADVYDVGWVVGDPLYRLTEFCRELVPTPDCTDRYASAWISFCVGRRVDYPRTLCRDCHAFGTWDPYDARCPAVRVTIDGHSCRGIVDFRVVFVPRWSYEVERRWCDRRWRGHQPEGRWRWSSMDGVKHLRRAFGRDGSPKGDHEGHGWDRGGHDPDRSRERVEGSGERDRGGKDNVEHREREERSRGNHEVPPRVKEPRNKQSSPNRDADREPKQREHRNREHRAR